VLGFRTHPQRRYGDREHVRVRLLVLDLGGGDWDEDLDSDLALDRVGAACATCCRPVRWLCDERGWSRLMVWCSSGCLCLGDSLLELEPLDLRLLFLSFSLPIVLCTEMHCARTSSRSSSAASVSTEVDNLRG
jgi:hypothetical protein